MELIVLPTTTTFENKDEIAKLDDSEPNSSIRSDGVCNQFNGSNKSDSSKSYKEKISRHFQTMKQKAIKNRNVRDYKTKTGTDKLPERLHQQWKIKKKTYSSFRNNPFKENQKFFSGTVVKEDDNSAFENASTDSKKITDEKYVFYSLPQLEDFQIKLSENDSFIDNGKLPDTNKAEQKCWEEGLYINQSCKVKNRFMALTERRLLATDDEKWFTSHGKLELVEYPLNNISKRPNKSKKFAIIYKSPHAKEKCNEIVIITDNVLEISLSELKFTHHPLFSIEHFLAEKLCNLYDQYKRYDKNNNTDRMRTKLEALRYIKNNMENKKITEEHTSKRIVNIYKDIQKLRKIYFEEGRKERENLKSILNVWKQIKKLRDQQKFSNTDLKLCIKKENIAYDMDHKKFKTSFQETLQEIMNERRVDLQAKSKEMDSDKIRDSESFDEESEKNGDVTIDEEDIRKNLQIMFQQSFRAPGEPVLKLSLSNNNEITKSIEHAKEITRRNTVTSTKIHLTILCDKVPVCKSKSITLNNNFCLDINETFSIQLEEMPKFLNIEVIEQPKGLLKKKICEISIAIPMQNVPFAKNKPVRATFETTEIVHYKHDGIGSGVNLKGVLENGNLTPPPDSNHTLNTKGYLEYCIGWQKTTISKPDTLKDQINLLEDITDKNLALNVKKLSDWMTQAIPDPQDPGNVVFFEYMADYDPKLFKNHNNFRLNPHTETFKFCNVEDIEKNMRFTILKFRDRNEIEFDGVIVPNRIKEIPFNALDKIKKRKLEETTSLPNTDVEDDIDVERNEGRKYLKKIHTKLFQMCKNSDNNLIYESVVDEKYLAHFENLVKAMLQSFLNWFSWHPNKPLLIKNDVPYKKKPEDHNKMCKQCNATFKIICGKNIPKRTKYTFNQPSSSETYNANIEFIENEIKPYIEISYANISVRTNTSSGTNPAWNQILVVPLEYQNMDYLNPESLNGTILVNLYDESDYASKYKDKKTYRWLGAVEIPLSAICHSTSMSGLFKVKLGDLLLGYETEMERNVPKSPKFNNFQSSHTYIQMEIGVTPNVPKLVANMEALPCGEIPFIQQHILRWNQNYNDNFPNRKFSVLAIDTNAKTTCITRYIKPLEPPQINLEEFDVTAEQCLRYVSLIPFTECNQFYHNVWLTTNELLHFMIGSVIDHAIALTCFLLALKMEVWLLLGYGIPHGSTAYVLTLEYVKDAEMPAYFVYDVVANEKHNLIGSYCPLQTIYCLVNGENVWANTQRNDNIQLMRFDLSRKSDWLSLFDNNNRAPTHFINNIVTYNLNTKSEHLENYIEMKLKKKISKLRQLDRTIWNHKLTNDFKNILRSFEANSMYKKNNSEIINELNEKLSSYRVSGYILNSPYINLSTTIKNIKKLGICCQENGNNEFALAVYIHTYPGSLLSLWIFIGNIIKQIDI